MGLAKASRGAAVSCTSAFREREKCWRGPVSGRLLVVGTVTGPRFGVRLRACVTVAGASGWGIWLGFLAVVVSPCRDAVTLLGMVNRNLGRRLPIVVARCTLGSDGCVGGW